MKEYNYSEMQEMQEKALERVKDMQQRAKTAAQQANQEISGFEKIDEPKNYRENFYNAVKAMPTPKQNHIKMPVEMPENIRTYESFKEYFEPENKRISEQKQQTTKANLLDDVLKEPDKALLFALLLLMQSDNSDEELMMSLLYIML